MAMMSTSYSWIFKTGASQSVVVKWHSKDTKQFQKYRSKTHIAQSVGAVEYIDCFSAEGESPQRVS